MGFKKTILLDQKLIVELVDRHTNDSLPWDEFPLSIKAAHAKWMGSASKRTVIPDRPKEEDYFYANPQDCLQDRDFLQAS
jgi:rhamnogalacturonan I rhamnosyltransferase